MSILKATHDAVISSLIWYGLLIFGSCLPEDLVNRLDVQVINSAARRISRHPMTTRVETLCAIRALSTQQPRKPHLNPGHA